MYIDLGVFHIGVQLRLDQFDEGHDEWLFQYFHMVMGYKYMYIPINIIILTQYNRMVYIWYICDITHRIVSIHENVLFCVSIVQPLFGCKTTG